jgi:hypothetical protein
MPAAFVHFSLEGERWLEMMLASGELSRAPVTRDDNHRGDLS